MIHKGEAVAAALFQHVEPDIDILDRALDGQAGIEETRRFQRGSIGKKLGDDGRPERRDAVGGKILVNAGALQRASQKFQIAGVVNEAGSQGNLGKAFAIQQVTCRQARGDQDIANDLVPIGAQAVFDEQAVAH